ncbi:MAG: hypothetical protein QOI25_2445 [Mycobacterium sp.]|jgi:hypothetical protein|nr:hypothetical protein [Mycobacterium sp.]MDT5323743.1 hypothetical protein [Mycobacterium sp.]
MLSIVSLDNIARALPGDHTIEAALTKWGITALAALLVAVTLLPWFSAHNDYGSAQMTGWGAWTTTGEIDASLRPLPLALLVYLPAGVMIYGALRGAFGAAVVGAMATFVAGLLPFMLKPAVDRHVPGRSAVAVDVAAAPQLVVAVALLASVVCWIGYARCVLRPAPRADA